MVARYGAELKALDAVEARQAATAELDTATRQALNAAAACDRALQRLSRAAAADADGTWAKAETLCVALAGVDRDEGPLRDLGRSLRDEMARIRSSERQPPSGVVRGWAGFRPRLRQQDGARGAD